MNLREPDPLQRHWPTNERPMVRLLANGARTLSDAEVLSVLIRKGCHDKTAVEISRELLSRGEGIAALLASPSPDIIGAEAAARLSAAQELVRRALFEVMRSTNALDSPSAVRDYLRLTLASRDREVFLVIHLDAQHRVLGVEELFVGTLNQTCVYPREVVKAALRANAAAVVFAHNHPSGVAEPSQADEVLTRRLREALALVDIRVLDHFIVTGSQTLSFAERGLL